VPKVGPLASVALSASPLGSLSLASTSTVPAVSSSTLRASGPAIGATLLYTTVSALEFHVWVVPCVRTFAMN